MDNNVWYGYEDQPYRSGSKKTKSPRSDHKHVYEDCLVKILSFSHMWCYGQYCTKCGRIKDLHMYWGQEPSQDEIIILPKFEIDSFLDKKVTLQN